MVPERRPTIKDVARLAGVSPGTASRVLSGSDYPVHPATRERVLRAAAELDYYPSAVGRALVRGRTGVIGAIVHDITDPFFNVVARGIEDVAGEHDYLVVVCNADRRPEKLLSYLTKLRGYHVDGVILVGAELQVPEYQAQCERYLAQLERGGVPVITVGRYSRPGPGLYYDNLGGISLLVRHLVDLGHRRIAHIAGSPNSRATTERLAGYLAALASCGLEIDSSLVVYGDYSRQSGSRAAETLMALPKPPTAIVAATDEMAAGCVRALRQQGVRVPEDVSVTGFNDVSTAQYCEPPLTTIRVPLLDLGMRAMQMVLRARNGERVELEQVGVELIVRESTGPAKPAPASDVRIVEPRPQSEGV